MTVFLRVLLANSLYGCALAAGALAYHGTIHPVGLVAIATVLCVYAGGAAYAAWLAYRDKKPTHKQSAHLGLAIRLLPMLALLGSISGFLIAFSGGAEDVQTRVLGASTGLLATFLGIASAILLMVQAHMLGSYEAE